MKILRRHTETKSCPLCYGQGYREKGNGDTIDCVKCDGKGVI